MYIFLYDYLLVYGHIHMLSCFNPSVLWFRNRSMICIEALLRVKIKIKAKKNPANQGIIPTSHDAHGNRASQESGLLQMLVCFEPMKQAC